MKNDVELIEDICQDDWEMIDDCGKNRGSFVKLLSKLSSMGYGYLDKTIDCDPQTSNWTRANKPDLSDTLLCQSEEAQDLELKEHQEDLY